MGPDPIEAADGSEAIWTLAHDSTGFWGRQLKDDLPSRKPGSQRELRDKQRCPNSTHIQAVEE